MVCIDGTGSQLGTFGGSLVRLMVFCMFWAELVINGVVLRVKKLEGGLWPVM